MSKCKRCTSLPEQFELLRTLCPTSPEKLGTSRSPAARPYQANPFQAGGQFAGGLKLDNCSRGNKASLPSLEVEREFSVIPLRSEAGDYNAVLDAMGLVSDDARNRASHWYGITSDKRNFYYTVHAGGTFEALFGGGSSSIVVARCKSDARLLWLRNVEDVSLESPDSLNVLGNTRLLCRVAPAILGARLYITTSFTNLGPLVAALNKETGEPIWSLAYSMSNTAQLHYGRETLSAPCDVPFRSQNAQGLAGGKYEFGHLHPAAVSLDGVPSVFVGTSSYQNAVNVDALTGFPVYSDQGLLLRIDDLGKTAEISWRYNTCAAALQAGDVIVKGGDPDKDPFPPTRNEVIFWRDAREDESGRLSYSRIMSYTGDVPGYKPAGYPLENDSTVPVADTVLLVAASPALTEASLSSLWRSAAPGIGGLSQIYNNTFVQNPTDVTELLALLNELQGSLQAGTSQKVTIWTYLSFAQVEATAQASDEWNLGNVGVRYAASRGSGATLNAQEAKALNYYGNSVWGQTPVLDLEAGLIYFGTGQSHSSPLEEILQFEDPMIEFYSRKQDLVRQKYFYAGLIPGETATLADVEEAKQAFVEETGALVLGTALKSPRGNRSLADALVAVSLHDGAIAFALRTIPSDTFSFLIGEPSQAVIGNNDPDGDVASGITLFYDLQTAEGPSRKLVACVAKNGLYMSLDITGFNYIPFDYSNFDELGIKVQRAYTGPVSALGGSNFALANDGGKHICYGSANNSEFNGSQVFSYDGAERPYYIRRGRKEPDLHATQYLETPYGGYEFHVTQEGRIFQPQESFVGTIDVASGQIVWEQSLGTLSNPAVTCYNGVFFTNSDEGTQFAFDTEDGTVLWKLDGTKYGWSGISPPVFDQGRGILINNYLVVGTGGLGNVGALLRTNKCELVTSDSCLCLLKGRYFESYDIIPKVRTEAGLVNGEQITHSWDRKQLIAIHWRGEERTEFALPVQKLDGTAKQVLFETFAYEGIRYLNIRLLNKNTYLLKYQRAGEESDWVTYEATFGL